MVRRSVDIHLTNSFLETIRNIPELEICGCRVRDKSKHPALQLFGFTSSDRWFLSLQLHRHLPIFFSNSRRYDGTRMWHLNLLFTSSFYLSLQHENAGTRFQQSLNLTYCWNLASRDEFIFSDRLHIFFPFTLYVVLHLNKISPRLLVRSRLQC